MGINIERKQDENEHARINEIAGVVLSALGVFGLLCLMMPDKTGSVGASINFALRLVFGHGAFAVPLLVFSFGFAMIFSWSPKHPGMRICGLFVLFLGLLIALDMPVSIAVQSGERVTGMGGGVVGAFFASIFLKAFAKLGTYIVLIVFLLVGGMLVFDLPMSVAFVAGVTGSVAFIKFIGSLVLSAISRIKQLYKELFDQLFPYSDLDLPPEAYIEDEADSARIVSGNEESFGNTTIERKTRRKKTEKKADKIESLKEETMSSFDSDRSVQLSLTDSGRATGLPSILLLDRSPRRTRTGRPQDQANQSQELEDTFTSFGMEVKVVKVDTGPIITRYELQPAPGIKVSRIVNLADDIALALAAPDVRIEAPIPGKSVVGIEVPNKRSSMVTLREVLETDEFQNHKSPLAIGLGLDIAGNPIVADLKKMLHVLVAGATGSGKSVCINAIISSILFRATPEEVRFLIVDPKMVELTVYNGIPHLVTPVVTDVKKAALALGWAVTEMERRYKLFSEVGVRNIEVYNEKCEAIAKERAEQEEEDKTQKTKHEKLPYLVIVIDELADLMMVAPGDVEDAICRLAQMARAAGIHLIIATQRPSADVITGVIKANIPSRIAFAVASQVDSRIILDMGGAERLIGRGDMLFYPVGSSKPTRVQGAYVSDKEVESLVRFLEEHGETEYVESAESAQEVQLDATRPPRDELFVDAADIVLGTGQASISMLQRKLRIGYARAARIIDELEVAGLVGPHEGSKPRTILLSEEEWAERCENEVAAGDEDSSS